MSEFTKGPWTFKQARGQVLACISMAGKLLIFKNKVSDQDGNLISAAPDLLEALELYMAAGHGKSTHFGDQAGAYSKAVAAIAKAKGGNQMTAHIDTCATILAQCMRITAQGKWHVFCEYAAHVDCLTVRWEPADTDYAQTGRDSHEGLRAYFGWGEPAKQIYAIRTELDKLEGGE